MTRPDTNMVYVLYVSTENPSYLGHPLNLKPNTDYVLSVELYGTIIPTSGIHIISNLQEIVIPWKIGEISSFHFNTSDFNPFTLRFNGKGNAWARFKLEYGTKATPYIPNMSDVARIVDSSLLTEQRLPNEYWSLNEKRGTLGVYQKKYILEGKLTKALISGKDAVYFDYLETNSITNIFYLEGYVIIPQMIRNVLTQRTFPIGANYNNGTYGTFSIDKDISNNSWRINYTSYDAATIAVNEGLVHLNFIIKYIK